MAEYNPVKAGVAGPGRPKGAKNKPNPQKMMRKHVEDALSGILKKSTAILQKDLEATKTIEIRDASGKVIDTQEVPDEDLRRETAKFFMSRFATPPPTRTYIEAKLMTQLEGYDDLYKLSKEAVLRLMDGDMTFEEVEWLQKIITTHAGIAGYMEVAELRKTLEELSRMRTIDGTAVIPEESRITWGQGIQPTHDGPDTPAE